MFSNPIVWFLLFVLSLVIGAGFKLAIDKRKSDQKGEQNSMKVNSSVLVVVVVAALVYLFQLPSLSIDINGIFTYAFDVVNAFMPLIAIIAGLGLGFNLITKISSLFNRAL